MTAADARSRVPQLLADVLVAVLVTVTATLITTYVVPSTQRISLVWLGGGVIAGVLAISSARPHLRRPVRHLLHECGELAAGVRVPHLGRHPGRCRLATNGPELDVDRCSSAGDCQCGHVGYGTVFAR